MNWERPSDTFLAYLERLSAACVARDRQELDKLLRMRLSSHLPRAILDELEFFRRAKSSNLRAPLKLMRYVHQMKQLATAPASDDGQLGLELRERDLSAPPPPSPAPGPTASPGAASSARSAVSRRARRSKS
jgi:hypothetical protein